MSWEINDAVSEATSKLKKELDEIQAQLFYNINELTDKAIELNAANAKVAELQQQNDDLVGKLVDAEKRANELEDECESLNFTAGEAEQDKYDAERDADEKDRVLQVALRVLDVTERELLMVENSSRPRELLMGAAAA